MRHLFAACTLAGLAACQPAAPATEAAAGPPAGPPPVLPAASVPSLFRPSDTLTAADQAVLRRCDLGRLWQGSAYEHRPDPILEGVFGPDHYRFELTFQQVTRDLHRPDYYQVRGKCHYRKNVRPFTGWLVVRELERLEPAYERVTDARGLAPAPAALPAESVEARRERFFDRIVQYRLRAEVRLAEQPAPNSGELRGEALLAFYRTPTGHLGFASAPLGPNGALTDGAARLVRGTRRNVATGQLKPFVVCDNLFVAARDVYQDFGVGERSDRVNPKYAHLGWNEKWENEEWWADSPAPRLGL